MTNVTNTNITQNNSFSYGAIADRTSEGSWAIWCNRCSKALGTTNSATMMLAIHNKAEQGGILCPECRKNSCKKCGAEITSELPCSGCMTDVEWLERDSSLLSADDIPF